MRRILGSKVGIALTASVTITADWALPFVLSTMIDMVFLSHAITALGIWRLGKS